MKNNKLEWFDSTKYDNIQHLNTVGWAIEIEHRLFIQMVMSNEKSPKLEAIKLIDDIKKYGLFHSKPLRAEDKSSNYWKLKKDKKFIENLTVFDSLEFALNYESKEIFESDYKLMDDWDMSEDARKIRADLFKKYSKPVSQEIIERFDRWDKEANFFGNNDYGDRYIKVDLNTTSEMLLKEFENWLYEQRKSYFLSFPEKRFKKSHLAAWTEHKLLQYWDIYNISRYDNVNITNDEIGQILFPDEYDVTISERVRKVIKPKAANLFRFEVQEALQAQTEVE